MTHSPERFQYDSNHTKAQWWQRFKAEREHRFLLAEHAARYQWATTFARGKSVLDVASGSGFGAYQLATHGARQVIGVELDGESVQRARTRFKHPTLEYRQDAGEELSKVPERFDVIVSFETIEHIDHDRKFLRTLSQHLLPDGYLLISTPNRTISNPGKTLADRPANPFHVREYTQDEFKLLLEEQFAIKKCFIQGLYRKQAPVLNRILRVLKRLSVVTGIGRSGFTKIRLDDAAIEPSYFVYLCAAKDR